MNAIIVKYLSHIILTLVFHIYQLLNYPQFVTQITDRQTPGPCLGTMGERMLAVETSVNVPKIKAESRNVCFDIIYLTIPHCFGIETNIIEIFK